MGTFDRLVIGLVLATIVLAAPQEPSTMIEEGRGKLRRAILPFLVGLVLKTSTLVPLKLMIMTFIVIMSLLTSKLAVLIGTIVALHQYYQHTPSHQTIDPAGAYSSQPYYVTGPGGLPPSISNHLPDTDHSIPQPYVKRVHVSYN